jgi:hypothetical protein
MKNSFFLTKASVAALFISFVTFEGPARAFTVIGLPDSGYTSSTTLIDITGLTNGSSYTSVTDGSQTVSFSSALGKAIVPSSWDTWNSPPDAETSTPAVLIQYGDSLTLDLSVPSVVFGLELEPNIKLVFPFSAKFYSGATLAGSIDLSPDGDSGSLLFAGSDGTMPFTKVILTNTDASSGGFAIAQLRYQPVPGPLPILGTFAAFNFSRKVRSRLKSAGL